MLSIMAFSQALSWPLAIATLFLSWVGWWDDWKSLYVRFRLIAQLAAVSLLSYQLYPMHDSLIWALFIGFFLLCSINFHNFMDGINGMLLLQTILTLSSLAFWQWKNMGSIDPYLPGSALLLGVMLYFNFRKRALLFLGDAGSTALGLLLAYLLIKELLLSGAWPLLCFFAVFFTDAGLTLLVRAVQKKNIVQAHREHLYELLVNEGQQPHLHIAMAYSIVQLSINIGVIQDWLNSLFAAAICQLFLIFTYFILRKKCLVVK